MSPREPHVLLVPDGTLYLSFRLLPILRRAGFTVDVLCLADDPVQYSRYVRGQTLAKDQATLAALLQQALRQLDPSRGTCIVAHEDVARVVLAENDPQVLQHWQPGATNPLVRSFLLSKFGLAEVREIWGLPIPASRVCGCQEELLGFGAEVGWPIITKPADSYGGGGVRRHGSAEEIGKSATNVGYPVLAQKYIDGQRGVVDLLCTQGRALAWLTSFSTRRLRGEFGPSTARLFMPMERLRPLVEQVAALTRFEGFCGFDWIEERSTGRYFLIEFHPRPPSGFRFGRHCGVDFSLAVRHWLLDEPLPVGPLTQPPGRAVAAHYFPNDLRRCLEERDWAGLRQWLPGSGAVHDCLWDDLPLLAGWLGSRIRQRFGPGRA